MAINTLITLRDALTTFVQQHEQLQRIEFEADDYRAPKITEGDEFPVLFVAPIGVDMGNAMNMHRIRIYVYERINDDRSDVWENANDTSLMLRDIRVWWNSYSDSDIQILGEPSGEFKCGDELDNLVGYYADFVFEIPSHGRCDVPINVVPDPSFTCAPANYLVQYVDGTLIESGTIASGGSVTVNVPNAVICQDANYTLTDSDGNVLESGTIPNGGSATIVAPDANISLNGVSFPSILSGGSNNIPVRQSTGATQIGYKQGQHWRISDSVITVNGDSYTDLQATDSLNIPIVNTNGIAVNTTINGSNVVVDDLPCASGVTRSTATLMKTGQTTSYRTGDDGDLEAGRDTDFFTLDTAPLHNDGSATLNTTTNRFTDILGGQTYADDIVLDWSTWNGVTLYGYKVTEYAVTSWNTAIDDTLATSIGIFTSGFRLTNAIELENICNWELTSQLNHTGSTSPFNTGGTWEAWTSNTLKGTTANAISRSHSGTRLSRAKTGTAPTKAWAIRTFSLSTSNILS